MIGRVLFIVAVNTAFFVAVLWYMPLAGILEARGYSPERILAVMDAAQPEEDEDAEDDETDTAPDGEEGEEGENGDTADGDDDTQTAAGDENGEEPEGETDGSTATGGEGDESGSDDQAGDATTEDNDAPEQLVATDNINVRDGQGTDAQLVGQVSEGNTVDVLTPAGDGDWVEIDYGDGTGWAYRPLFETP